MQNNLRFSTYPSVLDLVRNSLPTCLRKCVEMRRVPDCIHLRCGSAWSSGHLIYCSRGWQTWLLPAMPRGRYIRSNTKHNVHRQQHRVKCRNSCNCCTQVEKLVKGFSDSSELTSGGVYLGGVKYLSISPDPAVIRGKKGQDGVTVKKTVSALVIGIYGEGAQPGDGNTVVENLADYLTNQGI